MAKRLARDGFAVVANYAGAAAKAEQVVEEIKAGGGRAIAVQADVSSAAETEHLFGTAVDAFGSIDIVVNSAGIMPLRPIAAGDLDIFDKVIAINLRGTFLVLAQAAQRVSAGGRIIALSNAAASAGDLGPLVRRRPGDRRTSGSWTSGSRFTGPAGGLPAPPRTAGTAGRGAEARR